MWPPRIVPEHPVHELPIECRKIVGKKMTVFLNECFGEGAVETFDLALHLGSPGIRMEMDDAFTVESGVKVIRKLAPIVGLHMSKG